MITLRIVLLLSILSLMSCKQTPVEEQQLGLRPEKANYTAQQLVDRSIEYHGGAEFERVEIGFEFRGYQYRSRQEEGQFILDRISYQKPLGKITDRVTNQGYTQILNDEFTVNIADSMKVKFANSVNSVHYFARLPYGLNAPAAQKKLLGIDSIKGKAYHEVEVRFKQEGGGVDFQDVFVYWFDTQTGAMDYLAYRYETEGGGMRFRAATNTRERNGIRFQDYINYKPEDLDVVLEDLDDRYGRGDLIQVSEIRLENVTVQQIDEVH